MSRHLIRIMATLAAALTVPAVALSGAATATATTRPARAVPAPHGPVAAGRLRITGALADGGTVTAGGLRWRPGGCRPATGCSASRSGTPGRPAGPGAAGQPRTRPPPRSQRAGTLPAMPTPGAA